MNTYRVLGVKEALTSLAGKRFSPVYGDFGIIGDYPWGGSYFPDARFNVQWDEEGLWVTMCAKEAVISAHETRFGGPVCRDSCLEFFVNPCPEAQDKYINFEINPRGTMHIGVGAGREGRQVLAEMPGDMELSLAKREDDWWAVRYRVTGRLMEELTGHAPERKMRANFYKCDESVHPHFGTWNPVVSVRPDFHRPECFGYLELI